MAPGVGQPDLVTRAAKQSGKAELGSCRRPGHGHLPAAGLVCAQRGRVQDAGGVGGWGVGVKGRTRERVRGVCSRLMKL